MYYEEHILEKKQELEAMAKGLEDLYAIRAKDCWDRFYQFFIEFWDVINEDEDLVLNWHIKYLCDTAQEIVEKAIRKEPKGPDTIINIPPGTTKSTIFSQMLGAWAWVRAPWFVIIISTYGNDLSTDHSLKSKDIVKSDRYNKYFQPLIYREHGKYMHLTKDNEKDWRNNYGGIRYFTSVGGGVIGKHAHLIIWDDLIDVERSESEKFRKKAITHLTKTLITRKKNKKVAPTIGIMQRLHENDPTGYMLSQKKIKVNNIRLPASLADGEVKPKELEQYYINGLLDPVRLSPDVLLENKTILGSYGYAGQFGQNPAPEEGGMVKKAWFKYARFEDVPDNIVWDLWIDGAFTEKTKNDPCGLMMCGFDVRKKMLYVRHAYSKHMELPELLADVKEYAPKHGYNPKRSRARVEPKASGHSIQQMLRAKGMSAMLIMGTIVSDGKSARLSTASPRIEAGSVTLVEGDWNEEFVNQICTFPNATHDEYPDLIGYACNQYFVPQKAKGPKRRN